MTTFSKEQAVPLTTNTHSFAEGQAYPLNVGGLNDAGALLDARAKAAYRTRLNELQDELEEAQRFNDPGRAAKAQTEIEFLSEALTTALGLGGRDRRGKSTAERARSTVTKSIKAAIKKIHLHHPALGHYFATSIKTGTFCCYDPDPTHPISWTL